jgi:5'(3')-deoxyribonucleotidase
LKIAVDIDGVLADQVSAVLRKIEERYGYRYSKDDVNCAHWRFEGRDIWAEISELLTDPEYVMGLSVIEGSQRAVKQLTRHDVYVVTARRPETEIATKQWLSNHFPCLTKYYHAKTGNKHSIPSDVLIDDFDLNIVEFVKSSPGRCGILFMQPWSINETDIERYADQVYLCHDWQSVVRVIGEIDGVQTK